MLDKKDLINVKVIVQDSLKEFFETLILPYFEHNEKDHAEIRLTLKSHDKRFDSQDRELDSIQRKLEKNEDDHEEIYDKLEKIDRHVQNHEKRIKKLEVFSGLNN